MCDKFVLNQIILARFIVKLPHCLLLSAAIQVSCSEVGETTCCVVAESSGGGVAAFSVGTLASWPYVLYY